VPDGGVLTDDRARVLGMTRFRSPQTARDQPLLKIRGPADLVLAVPYLLGFHPRASLVVVGLSGGRLVVTARMDLADVASSSGVHEDVLARTLTAMIDGGSESILAMVFDDEACPDGIRGAGALQWRELADAVDRQVRRCGARTDDVMLVSCARWWSFHCENAECCPPEGIALADAGSVVPAAAAYAGMVALPERAALAEQLAPLAPEERVHLLKPLHAAEAAHADAADAAPEALLATARRVPPASGLSREQLVGFGAALRKVAIRDELWLAVDARQVDGRQLWRLLGRLLPDPYAAAPLFLFGWASWRAGDGALANIAADAALASDPTYTAADLLLAVLSRGVDPRSMPLLRLAPA
jgi:hypothetical protein